MYLSYDEYANMGGTADERAFDSQCRIACARLNRLTHGRVRALPEVPQSVKQAVFDGVTWLLQAAADDAQGRVTGFANDGMSISVSAPTERERALALDRVLCAPLWFETAKDGQTPLLYVGAVL